MCLPVSIGTVSQRPFSLLEAAGLDRAAFFGGVEAEREGRAAVAFDVVGGGLRERTVFADERGEGVAVAPEVGENSRHFLELFTQNSAGDVGNSELGAAEKGLRDAVQLVAEKRDGACVVVD